MHNYILVLSKHNKTACKTYVFQKTAFHTTKGYLLLYKGSLLDSKRQPFIIRQNP